MPREVPLERRGFDMANRGRFIEIDHGLALPTNGDDVDGLIGFRIGCGGHGAKTCMQGRQHGLTTSPHGGGKWCRKRRPRGAHGVSERPLMRRVIEHEGQCRASAVAQFRQCHATRREQGGDGWRMPRPIGAWTRKNNLYQ